MKKLMILFLLTILLSLQVNAAESYQRWIKFINEPNHVMTASEMADITASLSRREISAQNTYRLSTGITYKIPQPDLYLQYILMCVKTGEPTIVTTQNVVDAIQGGDVVRWGNDISVKVKNYYFSLLHNKIQFIDNYSGAEEGVPVLLINGKPKIKMDCGNPLGPYYEGIPQYTKPELKSEPLVFSTKKEEDWSFSSPRKIYEERTVDQNIFKQVEKEKKFKWKPVLVVGGFVIGIPLTGYGIYKLFFDHPHNLGGGPGGAPMTPGTPVIPPVIPGGPGGAPITP